MDVSLIANEVIDSLLKRNACGVICKLDIEGQRSRQLGFSYFGSQQDGI